MLDTLALGFGALTNGLFGCFFLFTPAAYLKTWELNTESAPDSIERLASFMVQWLGINCIFASGMALNALVLNRQLARAVLLCTVVASVFRIWLDFSVVKPYVLARAPLDESNWYGGLMIHVIDLVLSLGGLMIGRGGKKVD